MSASDSLMTQVNRDNVLAVAGAVRAQADQLKKILLDVGPAVDVGVCGGDPISMEASPVFNQRIAELLDVHWAHYRELDAAGEDLVRAAHRYGFTDAEVTESFRALRSAP